MSFQNQHRLKENGFCVVGNKRFSGNGGSVGEAWKILKGKGAAVVVVVVGNKLKGKPGVVW